MLNLKSTNTHGLTTLHHSHQMEKLATRPSNASKHPGAIKESTKQKRRSKAEIKAAAKKKTAEKAAAKKKREEMVKKIAALKETLAQEDATPRIGMRQAKQSGRKRDQASCTSQDDSEDADSNFELAQDDCLSSSSNIITEEEQETPRPAKKKKKLIRQEIDAAHAKSKSSIVGYILSCDLSRDC
jgi:hypothetical protein